MSDNRNETQRTARAIVISLAGGIALWALGFFLGMGIFTAFGSEAQAQQPQRPVPCVASFQIAEQQLGDKYGEVPVAVGLNATGLVTVLFVNSETRSWTITMTLPDGRTCLASVGANWEEVPEDQRSVIQPQGDPT